MTTEPADAPAPKKKLSRWEALGTFAVVALCCGGIFWFSNRDTSTANQPGTGRDAEIICQDFVRDRLKAPRTAEFSDLTHSGSGTFTVTGNVDAQNSFGAMLRMRFTCVVEDAGDEWRLTSLTGLT